MEAQSVIASNLARLRADKGLTQAELARRANLSRVALGKIERGEVTPRSDTLAELARALRVTVRDLVSHVEPLSRVRFRAKKRVNNREQILVEVSAWLGAYNWLERELGIRQPSALAELVGSDQAPENLARQARKLLSLHPKESIRDICGLLEDKGVKVLLLKKATDAFFGLSVAPGNGGPAVAVNTWDRISVERWIFTAAHELGHILLHKEAYDRSRDKEDEREEREADRFASHFLMPEQGFDSEWDQTRGLPLLLRVLKVKRIYRVSYKTVLHRLVESGRESREVWRIFQVQHKRQFGKTLRKVDEPERLVAGEFRLDWSRSGEPEGLSESDFVQDRLYGLVRTALEKDEISLGRAAEILRIPHAQVRELAGSWGR
jgi:Zn-dependent peptidase ImmA (M78 family)/transcriptional regulator with XRE-family HTH domain